MTSSATRVSRHRKSLREAGLRPVQLWVRDTRAPGFDAEVSRQLDNIRSAPAEAETLEWLEQVADREGWV